MKRLLKGILPLSLAVAPGFAAALFQGNFDTDHPVALFNLTVNTAETIAIVTHGYAGRRVCFPRAAPWPALRRHSFN